MKRKLMMTAAALLLVSSGADAAMPVIDATAIAKQIEQIQQLTRQLETARSQLTQLEQLHGSLNKLTNMGEIARLLNDPQIRHALPREFGQVEGLLRGEAGAYGQSFNHHLEGNTYYRPQEANAFYAQELERIRNRNAGQMTVGEQMYQAATRRIAGIDELRSQIGKSQDAKETLDLQARIQAESAYLQTDVLRMQALGMVQAAQSQVEQQRAKEAKQQMLDEARQSLRGKGSNQ